MKINYNISAAIALNSLNRNDNRLQNSMTRLSTGFKINYSKDNPSGLAMAKRMNAQMEGISQATMNAGDGVSIIEIADGAMSEIHDMLQRINELAVKASTGVLKNDDRDMIDNEVQQLKKEITRIAKDTEFNGQRLLDGSFDLRGYTTSQTVDGTAMGTPSAKMLYYSDAVLSGSYNLGLEVTFNADGTIDNEVDANATPPKTGTQFLGMTGAEKVPSDIKVTGVDGNIVTLKGSGDYELRVRVEMPNDPAVTVTAGTKVTINIGIDLEGFGAMDQQIGANEGQQLAIRIPEVSLENMGIASITMTGKTEEEGVANATDALSRMGGAIKYVSSVRSRLGAYQNRLEHTISSLDITHENVTAAYSRIMDTDMAEEMTEYTTMQVLSQASTSMLAQANERPSQVLQLLQ